MPYEDDEIRSAARARLEARMQRRGSANTLASNEARRQQSTTPAREPRQKRQSSVPPLTSGQQPRLYTNPRSSQPIEIGPLSFTLPSFIPPIAIPIAAAILVLLLIFAVIIPSCTRSGDDQSTAAVSTQSESTDSASTQAATSTDSASSAAAASTDQTATQTSTQTSTQTATVYQRVTLAKDKALQTIQNAGQVESLNRDESHQGALVTLLGDESSAKLLAEAKTNVNALWIAAHPADYAFDGVEVQYKILKLAADEPASLEYVREFPDTYPNEKPDEDKSLGMSSASPSASVEDTDIPHLYQWDRRWGYTTYSGAAFGLTGCGPTSMAMVYQGLTGKKDKNPYDMGKLADENGYMSEYEGTDGSFFIEVAENLGLECEELWPDSETLISALKSGQVVIINLAPGYFTTTGHYLVATGLASDGSVIVNDPYSVERSSQTWDPDLLTTQAYVMYGYKKA